MGFFSIYEQQWNITYLQIHEMIFCCCLTSLKWLKSLGKYCRGSSLVPVSTCVLNGREKDSSKDLPAHLSSAKCPEGKWTIKVSVKHQGAICMSSLLSSVCPTDRPVPFFCEEWTRPGRLYSSDQMIRLQKHQLLKMLNCRMFLDYT